MAGLSTIPVLCVIDSASIIANVKPGTASNPASLGSWSQSDAYVYMITNSAFVANEQAQSELTVNAQVGQSIQWTITSIDNGLEYNCILQSVNPNSTTAITAPVSLPLVVNLWVGAPNSAPVAVSYKDFVLQATVLNTSLPSIQYYIVFQILDTNGNNLGYYQWDPFIQVTN
jgi:nematocidal protein AidA